MSEEKYPDWMGPSPILPALYEKAKELGEAYRAAKPFPHAQLLPFCGYTQMRAVRQECLSLSRTYRETDLFKIYQTTDLGNVSLGSVEAKSSLRATMGLRERLYSKKFRDFLQRVTGCGELTDRVDCSFNVYDRGCHLLCHDDAISTRKLSYIIYLSDDGPEGTANDRRESGGTWRESDGGCLELYAPVPSRDGADPPLPGHSPAKSLLPTFNSMVVFEVTPGRTFHAVQEVFSSTRKRSSIQGWFHAPKRPDGWDTKASLRVLQQRGLRLPSDPRPAVISLEAYNTPSEARADIKKIRQYVNSGFTMVSNLQRIREQLGRTGTILLSDFLLPELASRIAELARQADREDNLGIGSPMPPDYRAGSGCGWITLGPVIRQRYMRFDSSIASEGELAAGVKNDGGGTSAREQLGRLLEEIRTELLATRSFARMLEWLTGLPPPHRSTSEIRRFRPGLDYTVGHYANLLGEGEVKIDVSLCFVNEVSGIAGTLLGQGRPAKRQKTNKQLWESDDFGGFEACVRVDETTEGDDAEAYVADGGEEKVETKGLMRSPDGTKDVSSVSATHNALHISVRRPSQMKFVRYVSSGAPGSRWDIVAEYEFDISVESGDDDQ